MRSLKYLNTVLTVIAALLTLNLYTAWVVSPATDGIEFARQAQAQGVGGNAARQVEILDKLTAIDDSVKRLEKSLLSGKVRVQLEGAAPNRK